MSEDVFEIAFAESKQWFHASGRESPFLSNFKAIDTPRSLAISSSIADAPVLL
jgi:hypothetical protein